MKNYWGENMGQVTITKRKRIRAIHIGIAVVVACVAAVIWLGVL